MKFFKLIFVMMFLSMCNLAHAQYYQYDDSATASASYPWIDISTTGTNLNLADDAVSNAIPIGFTFNFGGTNYTNLYISSNGILFFAGGSTAYTNTPLASTGMPASTVGMFGFWDDLYSIGQGDIYYRMQGTAPNRVFIVSFVQVVHYNDRANPNKATLTNMQFQLYENGTFVYKYGTTYQSGGSATIGVMVKNSSDIVQYSYNSGVIASGDAIVWRQRGPDHYEIEFTPDNSGLTCKPQSLTVRACSNSTSPCTNTANQSTTATSVSVTSTLGTFSGGSTTKTIGFTGQTTDTLSSLTAGTATLSIAGTTPLKCYVGTTQLASCQTTFSDTGLVFDWQTNPKTAGLEGILDAGATSLVLKMSAVKKSDATKACVGFVPSTSPSMSISYSDPATGSRNMTLTPTNSAGAGSTSYSIGTSATSVPFTWDANGNTYMTVKYVDAGKVNLNASISSPVATGNTTLISKPYALQAYNAVSDVVCANSTVLNSNTATKFCPSGETFSIKVRGYATDGTILPNFGLESATSSLTIAGSLKSPSGGTSGNISNTTSSSTAVLTTGVAVNKNRQCTGTDCYLVANLAWDNVGEIFLTPLITGDNYFGAGAITSKPSQAIGRFYPFSFNASSPSLINRVDSSCPVGSSFSYMDENIRGLVTLNALNKAGAITTNYDGTYMNPSLASSWNIKASNGSNLTSRMSFISQSGSWVSGVLNASLTLKFSRQTSPDGPYNSTQIAIVPIDSDGVTMLSSSYNLDFDNNGSPDSYSLGSTNLYFGRLKLTNALGSELLPLAIPIETQYYNSFGFTTNTQDSCTLLSSARFTNSNFTQNIASNEVSFTYPSRFNSGKQTLLMNKPSGGDGLYNGSFDITYDLVVDSKPYLQGRWTGSVSTFTENPKSKIVLARNPGKKGLLFYKENY